ncbi:MAG: serine/threonine protein kinase [Phycisphaerales bacterium]|nr:serine/threonine protein kinase [Phycisphaerales bacterium]
MDDLPGTDLPSDEVPTWSPAPRPSEVSGEHIGPYRLLEQIGEGGFGFVWLAERSDPYTQRVALKVIKPGMDSKAVLARFEQERQALAIMDHPNIAKVLDGGITERGLPYFVMEHVKGEPITTYCDRHRLTMRQRLELFKPVCEAIQHAHHKGIIHRDIKPSNVLVTVADEQPIPKVIDFGVAKAIAHTLTDKTIFTETGMLIGTPEYMSPEQAEMGGLDIDTRTDVYSLGVLLYELLTGVLPFDPMDLRSRGYDEIRRIIREVEPPTPSKRLTTLAEDAAISIAIRRQTHRETVSRELRRELEWVPLKAMRKDRTRRYATPLDLAQDIDRYLSGDPLEAGPESKRYRLRKFAKKNLKALTFAAAIFVLLVGGAIGTTWGMVQASAARRSAEQFGEITVGVLSNYGKVVGDHPELSRAQFADQITELVERVEGAPAFKARILFLLGDGLVDLGFDQIGLEALHSAIALHLIRGDQKAAAGDELALAEAYWRLRRGDEAKEVAQSALYRFNALGDRTAILNAQEALATSKKWGGEKKQAEEELRKILGERLALKQDPISIADTKYELALVLKSEWDDVKDDSLRGKLEEAGRLMTEALKAREAGAAPDYGPSGIKTINALAELARIKKDGDELDDALKLYKRAQDAAWITLGGMHPRTLMYEFNYGVALTQSEDTRNQGLALMEQVHEAYRRSVGRTDRRTLQSALFVARKLDACGQREQARAITQAALADAATDQKLEKAAQDQVTKLQELMSQLDE